MLLVNFNKIEAETFKIDKVKSKFKDRVVSFKRGGLYLLEEDLPKMLHNKTGKKGTEKSIYVRFTFIIKPSDTHLTC